MKRPDRLRRLTGESGSLRARSLGATAWTVGGTAFQRGLSLITNLIMTRLLLPDAFGLMAMVITVHILVEMISDIGLRQSVIRSPRGEDLDFLRVVWTVQIIRSAAIAAIAAACGVAIGILGPRLAAPDNVYADPRLPMLIVVSSLAILMRGFESTSMVLASRRLALGRVTVIETVNQIVAIIVMIALAQCYASVWILLAGMMAGTITRTILSHFAFRDLPMRLAWERDTASEMWIYGRWLILSSMAGFVVNQGDRFVMGALLDKTTFGIYVIATLWIQTAQMLINQFFSRVVISTLAEKLRESRQRFPEFLMRTVRINSYLVGTALLSMVFLAPWLIHLLYSPEYHGAAFMVMLLGFRYLPMRQTCLSMFLQLNGNSRALALSTVLSAIATLTLLPIAFILLGVNAALLAVSLSGFAASAGIAFSAKRHLPELDIRSDIIMMIVSVLAAATIIVFDLL